MDKTMNKTASSTQKACATCPHRKQSICSLSKQKIPGWMISAGNQSPHFCKFKQFPHNHPFEQKYAFRLNGHCIYAGTFGKNVWMRKHTESTAKADGFRTPKPDSENSVPDIIRTVAAAIPESEWAADCDKIRELPTQKAQTT